MNISIEDTLRELGLNETEIKTYLGLLKFGTTSASALGNRLNIPRSTARHTLQQLAKKQLASMSKKNGTFLFIPEDPKRILHLLDLQRREVEHKEMRAQKIIGQLQQMMNPHIALPKVEFFEGMERIEDYYLQVISEVSENSEILGYVVPIDSQNDNLKSWNSIIKKFIEEQKKKNIRMRILLEDSLVARNLQKTDTSKTEYRVTEYKLPIFDDFRGELFLLKEKMYAFSIDRNNPFSYSITDKNIIAIYRHIFELAWESNQISILS